MGKFTGGDSMNINIKLAKNFTTQWNKMFETYLPVKDNLIQILSIILLMQKQSQMLP